MELVVYLLTRTLSLQSKPLQRFLITSLCTVVIVSAATGQTVNNRPRARDIGLVVGIFPTGPLNAITDVEDVRVGQVTVIEGDSVRTGVTAILPHGGNVFRDRVSAAIHAANGYGKLLGVTQVRELGELETPILLTCTLCVWRAADAMVEVLLAQPDMQDVGSINPVVGETNDGFLNDVRSRPIRYEHIVEALSSASTGPVEEGSVGAGTGTWAFGWKGGIGTSSRQLQDSMGGFTVGILVQSNFAGVLSINGAPVGRELRQFSYPEVLGEPEDGSIMIVVATDAPLDARLLERLSRRALVGLARTGASMSNGSGDYVIAFSTTGGSQPLVQNDRMSPLFQAVAEATEEAIYNSLFRATTLEGHQGIRVEAIPLPETMEILQKYGVLGWNESLPPGGN